MAWRRLGRVHTPPSPPLHRALASHAALPVAVPLGGDLVRVFYSGRDAANRSALGTLLLRVGEIPRVVEARPDPVLTPGGAGAFDDAGIGMGSIVVAEGGDRLYYMGWNIGGSVPWRNAIGLAIGDAAQGRFDRFSAGPVTDSPSPVGKGERQSVPVPGARQNLRLRGTTHPGSLRPLGCPSSPLRTSSGRHSNLQQAHVRPLADSTRGPNLPVNPPMTSQRSWRRTSMSP
jgi:hypothetical protein